MCAYLNSFKRLQESLKSLEKDKKKITYIYSKIKKINVNIIDKIKIYKEKIDIHKYRLSFTKVINNSVSNFIILYILSFTKDVQKLENEYKQNVKYCDILKKKLNNIHIDITKTKLKLIIQS